jgi:hypothetical protein
MKRSKESLSEAPFAALGGDVGAVDRAVSGGAIAPAAIAVVRSAAGEVPGALPDAMPDGTPAAVSDAPPDAVPDLNPVAVPDAVPGAPPDAVSDATAAVSRDAVVSGCATESRRTAVWRAARSCSRWFRNGSGSNANARSPINHGQMLRRRFR